MADIQVLKTNKGGVKLVYNDYYYQKKKENVNGTITWKCCASDCCACLCTNVAPGYGNPVILGMYNHQGNPIIADLLQCCQDMKQHILSCIL